MSSSSPFPNSFDELGDHSRPADSTQSSPPIHFSDDVFASDPAEFSSLSPEDGGYEASNGPILPSPADMGKDEGVAVTEWRRENAIRLEEKERREKELLNQIVAEAEDYKVDFHQRRKVDCEANKISNREKEKLLVASQEKIHAEADKNYWKTITELIPNEVPKVVKRGKKEEENKPSINVIQGPKPGKRTELSRMRHVLLKLKHNTPTHLKLSPAPGPTKDAKTGDADTVSAPPNAAATVAVA